MPIETLDDIIEEIADRRGVYGSHGDESDDETPSSQITCTSTKPCRVCFVCGLHDRILAAVDVERKLAAPSEVTLWCTAWEWKTSGRTQLSPYTTIETEARSGTIALIESTNNCPHPMVVDPRLLVSRDGGKTWTAAPAQEETK